MSKHMHETQKWEIFLNTINKNIKVTRVTEKSVIIDALSEDIKLLKEKLQDINFLEKTIVHAIKKEKLLEEIPPINVKHEIKIHPLLNASGVELLKKLFNPSFFQTNKFNADLFKEDNDISIFNTKGLKREIEHIFTDVSALRKSLSNKQLLLDILDQKALPIKEEPDEMATSDFVENIIQIIPPKPETEITVKFNHTLLKQLLQSSWKEDISPPIIATSLSDEKQFILNKDTLLKFLGKIFVTPIIFEKETSNEFRPIMFKSPFCEEVLNDNPLQIEFLIDISQSMNSCIKQYKESLKSVMEDIFKLPNWNMNLTTFNDHKQSYNFNSNQKIELLKLIESIKVEGQTNLYGTMKERLTKINLDTNTVLIVFTDGVDNEEKSTSELVKKDCINLRSKAQLFSGFLIGLGEKYNEKFFSTIGTEAGLTNIKIKNIQDLTVLNEYIQHFGQSNMLIEIVKEATHHYHQLNSDISIGETLVSPNDQILIGGEEYKLSALGEDGNY
jgi:hypothetical protein